MGQRSRREEGNERKVGKMRREKFMLHIFERYSNETTCKMAATSREKDRKKREREREEKGRRLKREEVEHRGAIREARRTRWL